MGSPQPAQPVKLCICALSGSSELFEEAKARLVARFGAVDGESGTIPFERSDYYADEMGPSLLRRFWSFEKLIDPGELAAVKTWTNGLEAAIAKSKSAGAVRRPVNLDPGYVHLARVVLASTKDFTYRIYLGDGIYAEIALTFRAGGFAPNRWTAPEWQTEPVLDFFNDARKLYARQVVQNDLPTKMIKRRNA